MLIGLCRTVKPLLSDQEFAKTTEIVKEFGTNPNLGPKLQDLLEKRAAEKDSWVSNYEEKYMKLALTTYSLFI